MNEKTSPGPGIGIVNKDDFSRLALKIRMEKIDKEEIKKLRKETITNERYKTKMKKNVLELQRILRGYLARKRFKVILDELNTETIIDYLNHKRIKRIHSQAKDIISYYVNEYLNSKRQQKQKILIAYFNYCANIIKTTYESYKIRKKIEPLLTLIRTHKAKIANALNSFKVRLILRSSSMQNILVELANIKYVLNNMKKEDKNDLKTDFSIRLRKLETMFYVEYYKTKKKKSWVSLAKADTPWMLQYLSLIFKDNPKYTILNKRSKGEFNINNKTLSKKSFVKEEKEQGNKKYDDYDNKPIRPSNKNQKIEEENDSELNQHNLNDQDMDMNGVIEINMGTNKKKTKKKKELKPNPYDDYDNKPIKGKKVDFETLEVNESSIPPNGDNDQIKTEDPHQYSEKFKRKPNAEAKKRKPKYDARKAIEEAKEKEAISGKKEIKSEFRDFLREIKNNGKGLPPMTQSGNLGGSIGNNPINDTPSQPDPEKVKKEDEKKKMRKEPNEITMRKRLHDLERSPPPRLNLQNVKSRVECWTSETNESGNLQNIKRIKKDDLMDEPLTLKTIEVKVNRLSAGFNLNSYFKEKEEKMKAMKRIPYIKPDFSIVKKYSKEIYNKILKEINSQFEGLE